MSVTNQASIDAIVGATGSGKSARAKALLRERQPARLIVWDPMGEYGEFGRACASPLALVRALKAAGAGPVAAIFRPDNDMDRMREQFNLVCRAAYAAGDLCLVADELADVTTATHAPAGWSLVTRKGRHRGLSVIGMSQRPAHLDKSFWSQATRVRGGRLLFADDAATLGKVLRVPASEMLDLKPLQWIQRDMTTGQTTRGRLVFKRGRALDVL